MRAFSALMGELGWSASPEGSAEEVCVELETHQWALTRALQDEINVLASILRDNFHDDECRTTTTRQLQDRTPFALTVLLKTGAGGGQTAFA
jgi:hypothetical protein